MNKPAGILIWDSPTRVGHWLLALGFVIAYISAESERWRLVHVVSGTVVLAVVSFRVLWGLVGSHHARFTSFVRSPRTVLHYLRSLSRSDAPVHAGHNPAGGWSVVALLLCCLLTSVSGLTSHEALLPARLDDLHEGFAEFTLIFIGLHLVGIFASSVMHRENLLKAMLTGHKTRADSQAGIDSPHSHATLALLAWIALLVYWIGVPA